MIMKIPTVHCILFCVLALCVAAPFRGVQAQDAPAPGIPPHVCKVEVLVNSENRNNEAYRACDGDLHTYWHTRFEDPAVAPPHWIALDLQEPMTIEGFDYTPREDITNGTFENVKVYVCDDLNQKGEPVWTGVATM